MNFIVAEEGVSQLADGTYIEAGSVVAFNGFTRVDFKLGYGIVPVVLATIASDNFDGPVYHRLKVDGTGFNVKLQWGKKWNKNTNTEEIVNYIVIG